MSASSDDLRAAVAAQGWFHTIALGGGIVTDGRDESNGGVRTWRRCGRCCARRRA